MQGLMGQVSWWPLLLDTATCVPILDPTIIQSKHKCMKKRLYMIGLVLGGGEGGVGRG